MTRQEESSRRATVRYLYLELDNLSKVAPRFFGGPTEDIAVLMLSLARDYDLSEENQARIAADSLKDNHTKIAEYLHDAISLGRCS